MDKGKITFVATADALIINMREDCDYEVVLSQIEEKIVSARKFFNGASLAVKYRGKKLSRKQEGEIHDLLSAKTGADIKSFEKYVEEKKDFEIESRKSRDKFKMKRIFFKDVEEGMTKFYRGTVRSGQLIDYDGNVVVMGDVNPGGEIVATGNVVVIGSLRGMVHAGSDGNKDAMVVALSINPVQLRIADVITRPPDDKTDFDIQVPEIAYIKDDMMYIESFLPQR